MAASISNQDDLITTTTTMGRRGGGIEAQSAFASTLVNDFGAGDIEKAQEPAPSGPSGETYGNLFGSTVENPVTRRDGDELYAAKAQLLNEALLDIGIGPFQWFLIALTSVGWFLDGFWAASFTIIAPSSSNEAQFFYTNNRETYLFVSMYVGITLGGAVWPAMADSLGRKWIFTSTWVLMGMGGLVGAGLPAFTGLCVVGFVVGLAIAGNQATDAMILLEFLPASKQYLVALQGAFWGIGQLVAYAVGWAFISEWTCGTGPDASSGNVKRQHTGTGTSSTSTSTSSTSAASCHYVSNKGWRYVWWTFGCITLFFYLCRFTFTAFSETPKYMLSRRRDAEATQIVKDIATYNNRNSWLNESSFARIDSAIDMETRNKRKSLPARLVPHVGGVVGLVMLLALWSVTGMTFVLYRTSISNYLSTHGVQAVNATTVTTPFLYSRYVYVAICAIPGPIVAAVMIEAKGLGRKYTGAIIGVLTGIFMLASTASRSQNAALAFDCIVLGFLQFAMLAIITVYTVEVFPATTRGVGLALSGFCYGLFGLVAYLIVAFASTEKGAVWFSGAIWIVMAGVWALLPVETRCVAAA